MFIFTAIAKRISGYIPLDERSKVVIKSKVASNITKSLMDYKLIFPCHEISSSSLFSFLPPLDWLKFNLSNFPQFTTLYFLKAKLQSSKKYFFYISSSLMVDLAISTGFKNYVRMMQEFWLLTSVEEMSSWNFSVDKNKGQSIFLKLLFAVLLIRSSVPVLNRKKMCRWPHLKNTRAKSAGLLNILNQKKVI